MSYYGGGGYGGGGGMYGGMDDMNEMDPRGGGGMYDDDEGSTGMMLAAICCCLLVVVGGAYWYFFMKPKSDAAAAAAAAESESADEGDVTPDPIQESPDSGAKITEMGFDSMESPGWYPTQDGLLRPKKSKFEVFPCAGKGKSGSFSIRSGSKWLTASESGGRVVWSETKSEPYSCWRAVYTCADAKFVMLKNEATGRYLQTELNSLWAKSQTSSKGNSSSFCWRWGPSGAVASPKTKKITFLTKTKAAKKTARAALQAKVQGAPAPLVISAPKKSKKSTKKTTKKAPSGRKMAFSSLAAPGAVPSGDGTMVASPSKSLVVGGVRAYLTQPQACRATGATFYTITDHKARRLVDTGAGTVRWSTSGRESTCWGMSQGDCGNAGFVRLKSSTSGRYLKLQGTALVLDTYKSAGGGAKPSNAFNYCWKV